MPTLLNKTKVSLEAEPENPNIVLPIEYSGIKSMSFGFVSPDKRAVIRGPMVSSIISTLFYNTKWGELDYLIVDMPPGTGDIQITLGQEVRFDGAVIVTTPQNLSYIDVIKGIEMFDDLKVPAVSIVENMAYFECDNCTTKHAIFGQGKIEQLKTQFGIAHSYEVPLIKEVSQYSDMGNPPLAIFPDGHYYCNIFKDIAEGLHKEITKLRADNIPIYFNYDTSNQNIIVRKGDTKREIPAYNLRIKCQCALCIDEFSGKQILNAKKIPKDVFPATLERKGNYAMAITWSDGHRSSIYPFETLFNKDFTLKENQIEADN